MDCARLAEVSEESLRRNFHELFKTLSGHAPSQTAAGIFFESYAHGWFTGDGEYDVDELPVRKANSVVAGIERRVN